MKEYDKYISAIDAAISNILKGECDLIAKPSSDMAARGGKRFRPLLCILYYDAISAEGKRDDSIYTLAAAIELIHTASLIHDDIEDNSPTRRGKDACHIIYGADCAINCASALYFIALSAIEAAPAPFRAALYEAYIRALKDLHNGQALDIYYHSCNDFPTISEYSDMVKGKTGALVKLAVEVACIMAELPCDKMTQALNGALKIGEGFQMLDDAINLMCGNKGKMMGDDIIEGKKSYPILLHIQKNSADKSTILKYFCDAKSFNKDITIKNSLNKKVISPDTKCELLKDGVDTAHSNDIPLFIKNCIDLLNTSDSVRAAYNNGQKKIEEGLLDLTGSYKDSAEAQLICKMFYDMIQ